MKKKISQLLQRLFYKIRFFRETDNFRRNHYPKRTSFGSIGDNTRVECPCYIESISSVFLEENTRVRINCQIINAKNEKIIIKKYTAIGPNCCIIPGNHTSTVGIPHFILGPSHINDISTDITIEEDVWIGANVTLLAGAHIGRGAIIAAGSIVSKKIPPYAVVAGAPCKIISKKFDIDQIIEHESQLYPESERIPRAELEKIFEENFIGKKTFGISTELTSEQKNRINDVKKYLQYVEPF